MKTWYGGTGVATSPYEHRYWFIHWPFFNVLQRLNFKIRFLLLPPQPLLLLLILRGLYCSTSNRNSHSLYYYVSLSFSVNKMYVRAHKHRQARKVHVSSAQWMYRNWRFMVKWCKSISLQFYRISASVSSEHIVLVQSFNKQERNNDGKKEISLIKIFPVRNAISSNAIERPLPTFNQPNISKIEQKQSTIKVATANCNR